LFAVYLDDLSTELNNIKAGCYIGEVLLYHSMFADDICVFFAQVYEGCNEYLMCVRLTQNRMELFSAACMTFKAKSAKAQSLHY